MKVKISRTGELDEVVDLEIFNVLNEEISAEYRKEYPWKTGC